ncbi:Uu.00g136880.m01.CDS01 [Anthostomella pinea]|uniref:Uu.00g136880.m01.CDS01 n=1 Tax=Anthostomella pinea TaxID=933095 RepID=A0AAI8VPE2_9PEZI|nr:Uu.00g136880.m01.CDS01 [Anthostomella pinea]
MTKRRRAAVNQANRNDTDDDLQTLTLLDHRLHPGGQGQLDILVQARCRSSVKASRRWVPHEDLHRRNHNSLMQYWDSFAGSITHELSKLWPGRALVDIPHFPASILALRPARPSSRAPAYALVDWVGWHKHDCTKEPIDQVAADMPELLHDYYQRHGTANSLLLSATSSKSPQDQLATQIRSKKNFVVVTGAGVSIPAGPMASDQRASSNGHQTLAPFPDPRVPPSSAGRVNQPDRVGRRRRPRSRPLLPFTQAAASTAPVGSHVQHEHNLFGSPNSEQSYQAGCSCASGALGSQGTILGMLNQLSAQVEELATT